MHSEISSDLNNASGPLLINVWGAGRLRLRKEYHDMKTALPEAFIERMEQLLGEEYTSFIATYDQLYYSGLRINTLKIAPEAFEKKVPFKLQPIPWCPTGYYTEDGVKPGKHPYYHAGLYYIQEPSAMAPVEALDIQLDDRVLDLCAAPGGKSTQIAAKLQGTGLLVTNDISAERTKALAKNIELYGVRNAIVLNDSPERIANAFPNFFDRILIDAPCSGEGMFRKEPDMARQWEKHSVEKCEWMQQDILKSASALLAPGGTIVYSTCTFSPEENEAMIASFLDDHAEFNVMEVPKSWGTASGRPEWIDSSKSNEWSEESIKATAKCTRLWPHKIQGEGHFVAVLQHQGKRAERSHIAIEPVCIQSSAPPAETKRNRTESKGSRRGSSLHHKDTRSSMKPVAVESEILDGWNQFAQENLKLEDPGVPVLYGSNVYLSRLPKSSLNGLKTVRPGWYVGTVKHGRFIPGHPLAAALRSDEAVRSVNLSIEQGEAVRYLKGETLEISADRVLRNEDVAPKGFVLVLVDGISAGWGKWLDGILKNEYPAGWRWT